jgi:hypothetical protein
MIREHIDLALRERMDSIDPEVGAWRKYQRGAHQ